MRLLILGGTKYLGRHLAEHALRAGHDVTLFNRGRTGPDLFPGVPRLIGDRTDDGDPAGLTALGTGTWDRVFDFSGFHPRQVAATAGLLAPRVGQYVFMSSIAVYPHSAEPGRSEDARLLPPEPDDGEYGNLKVACEQAAEAAMPGRATSVRAGLISGPGDPFGAFTSWALAMAGAGVVPCAARAAQPVQVTDVRDLVAFLLRTGPGPVNVLPPGHGRNGDRQVDAGRECRRPRRVHRATPRRQRGRGVPALRRAGAAGGLPPQAVRGDGSGHGRVGAADEGDLHQPPLTLRRRPLAIRRLLTLLSDEHKINGRTSIGGRGESCSSTASTRPGGPERSTSLRCWPARPTDPSGAQPSPPGRVALPAMEERMVRYTREHKQETKQRIIATAGRRLKRDGIDGSGVAALMKDAGLTNGAFYAHFASKDSLVAAAIADQLHTLHANIVAQAEPGPAGLARIVRWYLSTHHRDTPGDGCPNAALLDEIGRCADATRQAYTDGVLVVIDGLAERMAPDDPRSARVRALSLLGLMAGTLQLSRALTDRQLSDDLLDQGLRDALGMVGAERQI